ncbi:hypothetical protein scyTo_0024709 [Scyliorhinus torazame]|uniref:guanylate cyclase n=1 Tax=Scyliorhinus torazame TaxID=75743 RepID=A0A401QFQ6_SCYTO|nr:hypothetical protein [Scyliorhinus torazame]
MKYVPQWDSLLFLGTPIIETVEDMIKMGVYVNDLNLHDSSRELILAGTQQSAELQLALDQPVTQEEAPFSPSPARYTGTGGGPFSPSPAC